MHQKIIAVAFLSVLLLVGVQLARTAYSFHTILSDRLTAMIRQTDNQKNAKQPNDDPTSADTEIQRKQPITSSNIRGKFSFDSIKKTIKTIETVLDDGFTRQSLFIELHGLVQRLLSKRVIDDVDTDSTIIVDSHHRLHFPGAKVDIREAADAFVDFHSFLSSRNISFLHVQIPPKNNPLSDDMPVGITIHHHANLDDLLKILRENNVPVMDLREEIFRDKLDWYSLHYRTDHHWKIETAFWAHTKVIEKLNLDYQFNLDPKGIHRDIQNYEQVLLPQSFLGTQGRRVGKYFAGVDDFSYLLPRFDTHLTVSTVLPDGSRETVSGSFFDAIGHADRVDESAPLGKNRYAVYFGRDYPLVQITNTQGKGKFLIIQDSNGLPLSAFFALNAEEMDIIDVRHFVGSLREFISLREYDLVLIFYGPIAAARPTMTRQLLE